MTKNAWRISTKDEILHTFFEWTEESYVSYLNLKSPRIYYELS